jgi:hypothetical protein
MRGNANKGHVTLINYHIKVMDGNHYSHSSVNKTKDQLYKKIRFFMIHINIERLVKKFRDPLYENLYFYSKKQTKKLSRYINF